MSASATVIGKLPSRVDRWIAAFLHLSVIPSCLIFFGAGACVAPFVLWWILMTRSPLVDHHGRASLNFAVLVTLVSTCLYAAREWVQIPSWAVIVLWGLVSVIAVLRASRGWLGRDISTSRWALIG